MRRGSGNLILHITMLAFVSMLVVSDVDCDRTAVAPSGSDTTSHDWTLTVDTLGGGSGACYLWDVSIINADPPLVYAVGQLYTADSTGQPPSNFYNTARWNGVKWTLQRIPLEYVNGIPFYGDISSLYAFSQNDIWYWAGNLIHWNGSVYTTINTGSKADGYYSKLWGTSDENLYSAGPYGSLGYFNGSTWLPISAGTSENINSIYGVTDPLTRKTMVLATASDLSGASPCRLLEVTPDRVDTLNTNGLPTDIETVWFDGRGYYVGGYLLYHKTSLTDSTWKYVQVPPSGGNIDAIRGNAWNDIVAVGGSGLFLHYNGSTWVNYALQLNIPSATLLAVSINGNLAVAVGTIQGNQAIAVVARRN